VTLDVRDAASARDMVGAATGAFGTYRRTHQQRGPPWALRGDRFDAVPEADWDATMAVNVEGIRNCCKRQCRRCGAPGWAQP
jgi:NAD(P)-dependent dehydrogenase (short-subunit alcohol dehydrogenase family)